MSNAIEVRKILARNMETWRKALPSSINADRMISLAVQAVNDSPQLQRCEPVSIARAALQAAYLGLEASSPLQEADIIPYKTVATFQPRYGGLIKLACKSPNVSHVWTDVVREGDTFRIHGGTRHELEHEYDGDRDGAATGYYACVRFADGGVDYEYMSLRQVEFVRDQSARAAQNGPWVIWFDEMARKTVLKRLLKRVPKCAEASLAAAQDNAIETGRSEREVSAVVDAPDLADWPADDQESEPPADQDDAGEQGPHPWREDD